MKASKAPKKQAQPTTKGTTNASAQGRRNEGVPASKYPLDQGAISVSNSLGRVPIDRRKSQMSFIDVSGTPFAS